MDPPPVDHPYALYSAGVAELDPSRGPIREPIIHQRDRKTTFLMTDSGGFQVANNTGNLKNINWQNPCQANQIRDRVLRWIELVADVSMSLDIPIWAITKPKSGFSSKKDCLNVTVQNWNYFAQNQRKAVRWINCLHGTNRQEGVWWYDAVKGFPTAGWAFGSDLKRNLFYTLWMLLHIRDDGRLADIGYIHFLGTMRASAALFYTQLQRVVRQDYPGVLVTYDAANASVQASVWGKHIVDAEINKNTASGQYIKFVMRQLPKKLPQATLVTKQADNIAREIMSIKGANSCVWITQKRKRMAQHYPDLARATDILDTAWASPNWQSVLLNNRAFLETYL